MKINESVSPSVFKNLAIVIGLFIVFSVWKGANNKIDELRFQPVFGESFSSSEQIEKVDLKSLPIVVAQSTTKGLDSNEVNDLVIEAAFKAPVFVDVEVQEPKATLVEKVFLAYRPVVFAVSQNGAVINGVFWRVGEEIKVMPVASENGQAIVPVVASVSRSQVVLKIANEKMTLPFERF